MGMLACAAALRLAEKIWFTTLLGCVRENDRDSCECEKKVLFIIILTTNKFCVIVFYSYFCNHITIIH